MSLSGSFTRTYFVLMFFVFATLPLSANTIHVPADYSTIQAAINAALNGDTVLVSDGTYTENIDFKGKAITVKSVNGPTTTIIDGGALDSVVRFATSEGLSSVLDGFTIRNGLGGFNSGYQGSGIVINNSSPTVTNNTITGNTGCDGVGIAITAGAPLVQGNTITKNMRTSCSGGNGGGGILIIQSSTAQIISNTISSNAAGNGVAGGGISLFAAGAPTIRGNLITGNSVQTSGGGIGMVNGSDPLIIGNVITGNTAAQGGGIGSLVPSGASGPIIVNNTIVANSGVGGGSELYLSGFYNQTQIVNNIFFGTAAQIAVDCDTTYSAQPPIFRFNDVFNPSGTTFAGSCTSASGTNSNISADPLFVNSASDFHLQSASPVIDVGSNSAPNLPTQDIAGNNRILDGKGLCTATVDMGAYEFVRLSSLTLNPSSLPFPGQIIGTTSSPLSSTLTNTSTTSSSPVCSITIIGDFSQTSTCGTAVAPGASCAFNVTFAPTTTGNRTGSLTISDDAVGSPHSVGLSGAATDFALAAAANGSISASVPVGSTATYNLQVSALNGFSSPVSLTCTGAPSMSICTVSPTSVTPGGPTAPFMVSVATQAPSLITPRVSTRRLPPLALFPLALALALALLFLLRANAVPAHPGRRALLSSLTILLFTLLCVAACGGGGYSGPSNPGTPKGTYTLTVTGTANSVSRPLSLTLAVN